jgi:hypothetical protein
MDVLVNSAGIRAMTAVSAAVLCQGCTTLKATSNLTVSGWVQKHAQAFDVLGHESLTGMYPLSETFSWRLSAGLGYFENSENDPLAGVTLFLDAVVLFRGCHEHATAPYAGLSYIKPYSGRLRLEPGLSRRNVTWYLSSNVLENFHGILGVNLELSDAVNMDVLFRYPFVPPMSDITDRVRYLMIGIAMHFEL